MRVILGWGYADALEFPHPDADFEDAAVVPELQIAAAGHPLRRCAWRDVDSLSPRLAVD